MHHGRACALAAVLSLLSATTASSQESGDLSRLSIDELLNVHVVSATRLDEAADLAPSTIYVVTAEEIERYGLRDLKEVLELVPGVDVVDPHFFLLGGQRGFTGSFSNTLLLVDGREMNNLIAGETFISNQFRTHNIKQVEVVCGPGSAVHGANALAGVINIITKTGTGFEGLEVSASYGSFDTLDTAVVFGKSSGAFSLRAAVTHDRTAGDDFSAFLSNTAEASPAAPNNGYRTLPNESGYDNHGEAWSLSLDLGAGPVYAGVEAYRNDTGRGTSGIQWDYLGGSDHRDLLLSYAGVRMNRGAFHANGEYRFYWEQFWGDHTEGEGPILNPETGATVTSGATPADIESWRGFYSNKDGGGSRRDVVLGQVQYDVHAHALAGGIQYEHSDIVAAHFSRVDGTHPPTTSAERQPEYTNFKWSAFAQDQIRADNDRLIITLGARYDRHESYGSSFNPRAGVVYRVTPRSTVKFLYGEAFREPNVFELQHNPAIRPTSLRTLEAGWNQFIGTHLKNELVFFRNRAQDLIVTDEVAVGGISNKGELRSRGFEDLVRIVAGRWSGFVGYTHTTADLREPVRGLHDVLDIPRRKLQAGLSCEVTGRFTASAVLRHHGPVETEYHETVIRIPAYAVLDAALSVPLRGVELRLTARNLFDTTYFHPEPRAPSVVKHPQNGREISVGITFRR